MSGPDVPAVSGAASALTPPGLHPGQRPSLDLDDATPLAERLLSWLLVFTWVGVAAATIGYGLPYYRLPLAARADSPLDELLRPSGLIGQGYGVVGTAFILIGVSMYSLRKRIPFLRQAGALHLWLEAHIFLCTLGPFLVTLHTGFKFGGIVAIAYWAMAVVALSGLFGRYVYGHIPRTLHGQRSSLAALRAERGELVARIESDHPAAAAKLRPFLASSTPRTPRGLWHALALALQYDLTRRSRLRRLTRAMRAAALPAVVRDDLIAVTRTLGAVEQQHVLLQPFQRLFHYWHILHLPLTVVMFVVLGVHIAVAIAFGYTWSF